MADWETRRNIEVPFLLETDDGERLLCEAVLRVLPGRRVVCRARHGERTLLVKLFLGAESRKEADADARGSLALEAAGVRTPPLRGRWGIAGKNHSLLAYNYLGKAVTLKRYWPRADDGQKLSLLEQLVGMMARMHQAGLVPADFHLDNFLVDAEGRLYAIDGGDYVSGSRPLGRRHTVRSLGALFGHFPHSVLLNHPELLARYQEERGWQQAALFPRVLASADRYRRRLSRRIARKASRNCSEFMLRRYQSFHIVQRRDLNAELIDAWINGGGLSPAPGDRMLKEGNSQTVWQTQLGGRTIVVKRYNLKNAWHRLRRALVATRGSRSWYNAHALRPYHIQTPLPLALVEERRGWLRGRAWYLAEKAVGERADRFITADTAEATVARLARVVFEFGENGLVHSDMKASNFMIDDHSVEVIDLDGVHRPRLRRTRARKITKDRRRFLLNWKDPLLCKRFERYLSHWESGRAGPLLK
ncbi:MAG TPA: hypothetical protein EYP90_06315 [Chromatiaceae bacterium]|nr:hypothetical protein [Chromatiaceae bacterium]